jgi:hypothetical protein
MGLPDEQRQAWIEEIEAALEAAAGAWRLPTATRLR